MVTIEYRCEDGTTFPVRFETAEDAAATWRCEREHMRDPFAPLAEALERIAVPGAERAHDEVGLVLPSGWRMGPHASGFSYYGEQLFAGDEFAKLSTGCAQLIQVHGSALRIWHDRCLPRAKEAVAFLDAADESVPLATLAEQQAYALHMTMIPAYVCGHDVDQLAAAVTAVFPDDAKLVAHELAQGYENDTLGADQALWRLARLAAGRPVVLDALAAGDAGPAAAMAALRATGDEAGFFAAVDAFLAEYGHRSEGWDVSYPTWQEQGDGFWKQLVQLARPDAPEPAAATARAAERRRQLAAEVEARLAADADALARFRRRYERVSTYVAVREERARWQLAASGALRSALLRRGRGLVDAGVLDRPDDVFYLLPDEIEGEGRRARDDLRETAARRRAEHEFWKTKTPPLVIGGEAPTAGTAADAAAAALVDATITGAAASRGVATGRARVVLDLADADRFDAGDVLVCVMTSPPWTPLFGIAAAVVVDSGDIASHPGIAAREYGIPCVLGTGHATRRIPDGALVRVDGDKGTVEVLDAPLAPSAAG